jgi:hypothetical protein
MEWVTLAIAILGLGLGVYNAYIQRKKDERRLKVIVEQALWLEDWRLLLINTGIRPVTIMNFSATLYGKREKKHFLQKRNKWFPMETVPRNTTSVDDENGNRPEFPVTIKDGETIIIHLSPVLGGYLLSEEVKIEFQVYDVEGNIYKADEYRYFDAKYNRYGILKRDE